MIIVDGWEWRDMTEEQLKKERAKWVKQGEKDIADRITGLLAYRKKYGSRK